MAVGPGALQRAEQSRCLRLAVRDLSQIRCVTAPGCRSTSKHSNPGTALFCCPFLALTGIWGSEHTLFPPLSRLWGSPACPPGGARQLPLECVSCCSPFVRMSQSWLSLQLLCLKFSMPLARLFLVLILNREGIGAV